MCPEVIVTILVAHGASNRPFGPVDAIPQELAHIGTNAPDCLTSWMLLSRASPYSYRDLWFSQVSYITWTLRYKR